MTDLHVASLVRLWKEKGGWVQLVMACRQLLHNALVCCICVSNVSIPAGITAAKARSRSMHMSASVFLWDNHLHYKTQSDQRAGRGKGHACQLLPSWVGSLEGCQGRVHGMHAVTKL